MGATDHLLASAGLLAQVGRLQVAALPGEALAVGQVGSRLGASPGPKQAQGKLLGSALTLVQEGSRDSCIQGACWADRRSLQVLWGLVDLIRAR